MMHIPCIRFYYRTAIAARRESEVWFNELGGLLVPGLFRATTFFKEVFKELWKP